MACFSLLALVPWLAVAPDSGGTGDHVYLVVAPAAAAAWAARVVGCEIVGFSAALYMALNEGFYGGLTPYSALPPGAAAPAQTR